MTTPMTVTTAAAAYLVNKLASGQKKVFRLTIKKTGCSGYSYVPEIIAEPKAGDTLVKVSDELTIYIDTTWMHLLEGVTMDYVEEEKMGLKQKRLLFINPKESGRCGCGESFHVS